MNTTDESITLFDFTDSTRIDTKIHKIGKWYIPGGGLYMRELKVFGIAFMAWIFLMSLVVAPFVTLLIKLFGGGEFAGPPRLAALFIPPLIIALSGRKQLKHGRTFNGKVFGLTRRWTDDPVHLRGRPVHRPAHFGVLARMLRKLGVSRTRAHSWTMWSPADGVVVGVTASAPAPVTIATADTGVHRPRIRPTGFIRLPGDYGPASVEIAAPLHLPRPDATAA